jgi:diguanylate cyclase (GGDEF)-like protein
LDGTLTEARSEGSSFALLIADIDHFKLVNDVHGHPTGDKVIQQIGAVLSSIARSNDVAARIGGEEFALILPRSDLDSALSFAERLRRRVADEPFETGSDGAPLSITTSVGVALFPTDADTASTLYARADAALYAAKRTGRNRVCRAN